MMKENEHGKNGETALTAETPHCVFLQNERRFLGALDELGTGMILTDSAGRITFLNASAQIMTAWIAEEAVGRSLVEMFGSRSSRENAAALAEWQGTLKTGLPLLKGIFFMKNHLGEQFLMEDRTELITAIDDAFSKNVLQLRPVSAAEYNALASKSRKEKLESLGRLARGFAHDFNNVLTVLLGHLSMAHDRISNGEDALADLQISRNAAFQATNFVQQLSVFARGGSPVREKISLSIWLKQFLERVVAPGNVLVKVEAQDNLPPLFLDPAQLQRLLTNLLDNSIKAIGKNEGAISIRIRRATAEDLNPIKANLPGQQSHVLLEVIDNGQGISPEHLPKIFDPYFSGDPYDNSSGIGLTVCKAIVEAHQGTIAVSSVHKQGTIVQIYFPMKDEKAISPTITTDGNKDKPRILILEDEMLIRRLMAMALRSGGFLVEETEDGLDTVKKYEQARGEGWKYDLVIMDLHIPRGLGGLAAMETLREMDPTVQALVSSGYSDDPVMANYQDYGFCGALPKPYEPAKLLAMAREMTSKV